MGRELSKPKGRMAPLPLFARAMRTVEVQDDLAHIDHRPTHLPTGLPSVDRALGGGLPVGGLTLVAARHRVGATSLLMGTALRALENERPVAFLSERLRQDQVRGRLVILKSQVNGHRFGAGFVGAEDRIRLAKARNEIPWRHLSIMSAKSIALAQLDEHIFTYRPWLAVFDARPRAPMSSQTARADSLIEGCQRLASIARRQRTALALHCVGGLGALSRCTDAFDTIITMHRDTMSPEIEADLHLHVHRRASKVCREEVDLVFDSRFAGIVDPAQRHRRDTT